MNDGPPHKAADEWRGWAVVDLAQALPAGDAADGREEGLSSGIRLRRGGLLRDPAIELSLRDRRSLGPLGHCQGEAMVPSGDPTFDLAFCVVTTDPERCAALLQVSSLREALLRARGDAGLLELAWADGDARLTFSAPLEGGLPGRAGRRPRRRGGRRRPRPDRGPRGGGHPPRLRRPPARAPRSRPGRPP